jgi:hypothetical protein
MSTSGVVETREPERAVHWRLEVNWHWGFLHNYFSGAVLYLSAFHMAINWDWVLAAAEKVFRRFREGSL